MGKTMVRKAFMNKKTKQLSITLSKKEIKSVDPSVKFGENLFVELKILKRKK